jgi:hypothetical protein
MNPIFFYECGKSRAGAEVNTFIGNMGATINTVALLATYLGIPSSRISGFKLTGLDIECAVSGTEKYTLVGVASSPITFFIDKGGKVGNIGSQVFRTHTQPISMAFFPAVINQTSASVFQDSNIPTVLDLANCVSLPTIFYGTANTVGKTFINIPRCLNIGATQGLDVAIRVSSGDINYKINAPVALQTSNNGGVEGDLADSASRGSTIVFVTNFTPPNPVTDLSSGAISSSSIQLNLTTPASTNGVDYYECYANGVLKNTIKQSGLYISGLSPNTPYNITVIAVDVFYNKSVVSNSLSVSTTNTSALPLGGLVAYYKLESNTIDSFGAENAVASNITYGAGKVGVGAVFNGSTSQISRASAAFDFFGKQNITFNLWVKLNVMPPTTYVDVISVQQVANAGTIDKAIRMYNNGSVVFYAFDGTGQKFASSPTGLIVPNNFYMLTGSFDGNFLRIYINSVLYATGACAATFNFGSPQLTLGKSSVGTVNGTIDEVAIYSTLLSQNQIDVLYNNGNGITL